MTRKKDISSVAITGTRGYVGQNLLLALAKDSSIKKVMAIDIRGPKIRHPKIILQETDLCSSESVDEIGSALKRHTCNTMIHCAIPNSPKRDVDFAHELHVIGTMNALLACEVAGVKKIILPSSTEVYGAFPDNPNFLAEDCPARGGIQSSFLKDKIDAETQCLKFQKRFPKKTVTILRPCTTLCHDSKDFKVRFFSGPNVFTVLGFDPLMQFIHISDLVRAIIQAAKENHPGIFNIAGDGVLPLSRALKTAAKINLPVFEPLLKLAATILWNIDMAPTPAEHIDFLKYQFVADCEKIKKAFGFSPVYSSNEALLALRPEGGLRKILK